MKENSVARGLLSIAVLFVTSASAATTPTISTIIYPDYMDPNLPSNPVFIAHTFKDVHIDPANVVVRDAIGRVIPSTATPDADEKGGVMVKTDLPLAQGSYTLNTGVGQYGLNISGAADTTAPSAIVDPTVLVVPNTDTQLGEISIAFSPPTDDITPSADLAYDIWVSQAPAEPDLNSKPTLMGTGGPRHSDGKVHISLAPGTDCLMSLPSKASGNFIVRLRARDAAGNLGPATPSIPVQVDELPECSSPSGKGCTVVPMFAPAAWVAVALWLRRRQR